MSDDRDFARLLREAMQRDAESAPDFAATLARARARRGARRDPPRRALRAGFAVVTGATIVCSVLLWLQRPRQAEPAEWPTLAEARALDRWRPATDSILGSPAWELIETTPRFGTAALEGWGFAVEAATKEDPS
jgi:hypothetical protein